MDKWNGTTDRRNNSTRLKWTGQRRAANRLERQFEAATTMAAAMTWRPINLPRRLTHLLWLLLLLSVAVVVWEATSGTNKDNKKTKRQEGKKAKRQKDKKTRQRNGHYKYKYKYKYTNAEIKIKIWLILGAEWICALHSVDCVTVIA